MWWGLTWPQQRQSPASSSEDEAPGALAPSPGPLAATPPCRLPAIPSPEAWSHGGPPSRPAQGLCSARPAPPSGRPCPVLSASRNSLLPPFPLRPTPTSGQLGGSHPSPLLGWGLSRGFKPPTPSLLLWKCSLSDHRAAAPCVLSPAACTPAPPAGCVPSGRPPVWGSPSVTCLGASHAEPPRTAAPRHLRPASMAPVPALSSSPDPPPPGPHPPESQASSHTASVSPGPAAALAQPRRM